MKTIHKIGLSGILIAAFGTAVQAQSWHRPAKPHENSAYSTVAMTMAFRVIAITIQTATVFQ